MVFTTSIPSTCGIESTDIFHLLCIALHLGSLIYRMVFSPTLYSETFLFSFGLIASTICCVFTRGRSRSRGQRRHQAPSSPQPPPLTAFNTRIRQQTPALKSTATTLASPQPPIHLRSNSAPISNRSPSRHSSRPKPDASSRSQKKPDFSFLSPVRVTSILKGHGERIVLHKDSQCFTNADSAADHWL